MGRVKKQPYIPFYTGDWLKDPSLSLCSPATRGVWIDLLSRMHEAGRVGSLSGTQEQLARLARCVPADLALALTDLQTTGTADVTRERNGVVTVTNRRMSREAKDREANALRQARHRSSRSSNGEITAVSPLYEDETENEFYDSLSEVLRTSEFKSIVMQWLNYKRARGESYSPQGRTAMLSRAAKLASIHGIESVVDSMERAMGNNWQGWDQPNAFGGNGQPSKAAQRPRAIRSIQ